MNKKFLSVVLFGALMAGSSVTFTGCIDNDEPAGIENLRGAKAELLKAKAAVETANAAYRDAETQLKLAEVEKEKLTNESIKLANQLKELELQEETAKTEAPMLSSRLHKLFELQPMFLFPLTAQLPTLTYSVLT